MLCERFDSVWEQFPKVCASFIRDNKKIKKEAKCPEIEFAHKLELKKIKKFYQSVEEVTKEFTHNTLGLGLL